MARPTVATRYGHPTSSQPELVDAFIRLLFGVILEKKGRGRGSGDGGADCRAAVLSAFGTCSDKELGLLVNLMLRLFGWDHTSPASGLKDAFQLEIANMGDDNTSDKHFIRFLTLLGDLLKNLGSRLLRYWPAPLGMTINLAGTAQARIALPNKTYKPRGEGDRWCGRQCTGG